MGQFLQVNGDYNIKTRESGNIILDTGPGVGFVRVTGNLLVEGDTLTVSAENLNVNDNLIVLNFGESGPGVSLDYSGIEIDRGFDVDSTVYPKALFILDDRTPTVPVWTIATGSVIGGLEFADSNLRLRRIFTDADTDQGHLTLIGDSAANGVVNVAGTINYEQQVQIFGDDAIPNKKYVDDAIQSNPTFQILRNDTRVVAFDKDDILDGALYFPPAVGPYTSQPAESLISIVVDDVINSIFFDDKAVIQDLEFSNTEITTYNDSNINILIRTKGTGKLQTNYALQIDHLGTDPETTAGTPSSVIDATLLYSDVPSVGTTGLYFVNTERNGELINKNKALLFSMIF
jgi:hypothetical protein